MTKAVDLAIVSHEIRTPLSAILGVLELLGATKLDQEQRRLLDSAAASGRMLQGLLADILELSRPESSEVHLLPSPFDPTSLVRDVCALLTRDATERGVALVQHVTPRVPAILRGDALRIQQVLINLLANAVKFTEQGFVKLSVDAEERCGRYLLRIDVEDSGVGIPSWQLDSIFEPFHQANLGGVNQRGSSHEHDGASNCERGVGLGLAITRRLVCAMRGEIEVESQPGIGSTFRVTLPLDGAGEGSTDALSLGNLSAHVASRPNSSFPTNSPPQTEWSAPKALGTMEAAVPRTRLSVMVADDSPINRLLLEHQLQRLGCDVVLCETGQSAFEEWMRIRPDLLLSDLYMPGLDGLDLVRAIRRVEDLTDTGTERPRTTAVLVSAASSPVISAEAIAAGFDCLLPKPFRFQDLVRLVEKVPGNISFDPSLAVENRTAEMVA